jgi:hypothetical protein
MHVGKDEMSTKRLRMFVHMVTSMAWLGLLAFGSAGQASAASVIYVRYNAIGLNNGTSWANAYTDLQSALAAAVSGQQIWVAQGTYYPTTTTDRTISFDLRAGVAVYGGFAGGETLLSQRNFTAHVTALSGDIGTAGDTSDNSFQVVVGSSTDNTAVLDGFTVSGGNADGGYPVYFGGGIRNERGSPTLRNLVVEYNHASGGGGGIYNWESSPILKNVTIQGNGTDYGGGGMQNELSSPLLTNVAFIYNTAFTVGGGMYNEGASNPTLTDVVFWGNAAAVSAGAAGTQGGGMENVNSNPTLTNVTFYQNLAGYGGGMHNSESSPILTNVTFSANSASSWGSGMYNDNSSNPAISDGIFWGDVNTEVINTISTSSFTDSIVQGGCPFKSACTDVINADPIFGPFQDNGGFTRTLALGAGSAAIDAGGFHSICAATDQRGVSRPQGTRCDIGAYEVRAMAFVSQRPYDGWVLESGQDTNTGGSLNSTALYFRVGDDASNRRYRGFLSFDTASLPPGVTLIKGTLRLLKQTIIGDPFGTGGNLVADLSKPYFGSSPLLQLTDFNAPATVNGAGSFGPPNGLLYSADLNSSGLANINLAGTTQFRLRFDTENYNNTADYISFFIIDILTVSHHFGPTFFVYYNP